MFAIVGLGNPGPRYERTRHNAGVWVVERLAATPGVQSEPWREKFRCRYCKVKLGDVQGLAILPQGFMNESGDVVQPLLNFFKISPTNIIVVHDELDLEPGMVRLKRGGSSTHNGVNDLTRALGESNFTRIRVGIGHPRSSAQHGPDVSSWVLSVPTHEEQRKLEEAVEDAQAGIELLLRSGLEAAQGRVHRKKGSKGGIDE